MLQVLTESPNRKPFGAGLKPSTRAVAAKAASAAASASDKENVSSPVAKPWKQAASKDALGSKAALEPVVKPMAFKANNRGAMLVFSPSKLLRQTVATPGVNSNAPHPPSCPQDCVVAIGQTVSN